AGNRKRSGGRRNGARARRGSRGLASAAQLDSQTVRQDDARSADCAREKGEGTSMAATAQAVSAAEAERQELRGLLHKNYRWLDYKFDLVFWVTAAFVVGAAADITKLLFAGDWDFWTDWKDRQWWPIISPFAFIIIPSALQYIQWLAWRFPTGATYTAVCMFLCSWVGR